MTDKEKLIARAKIKGVKTVENQRKPDPSKNKPKKA